MQKYIENLTESVLFIVPVKATKPNYVVIMGTITNTLKGVRPTTATKQP